MDILVVLVSASFQLFTPFVEQPLNCRLWVESGHKLWQRSVMNEPDLTLDGLSIWVRGRANPNASDFYDGNWLIVRAAVQVGQSSVTTEGAILMVTDFERFRDQLAAMHETLTGEASLSGYEPNLKVTLRASRLGQIGGAVEITPDQMNEFHRFDVGLDQTYLPNLVASCDAIIQSFPVVGRPEG